MGDVICIIDLGRMDAAGSHCSLYLAAETVSDLHENLLLGEWG